MGYEETFTKSKDPDGAIVTKTTTILGKEFTHKGLGSWRYIQTNLPPFWIAFQIYFWHT